MAAVLQFFVTSTAAYTGADKALVSSPSWWTPTPAVVDRVGEALAAAGNVADQVSEATKNAARTLLLLLSNKPDPEITIEETGEISFEWYRDNHHVAVLTVDDQNIRWAAVLDANTPAVSGAQPFAGAALPHVPPDAMTAIDAVI